jgi:hypothetical protein
MSFKEKFKQLGNIYNTDKVSHHHYEESYPIYLEKFKDKKTSILEIGLEPKWGKASLNLWLDLFPNMYVYGLDIGTPDEQSERYSIFQCDQSKISDLKRCKEKINHSVSIIVDDGSHIPEHQLLAFNEYFPILEVGGVYIIEDIETSYWTKGECYEVNRHQIKCGKGHKKSIVEIFKQAIDGVNYEFSQSSGGKVKHQKEIESICFHKNCIIITKREPESREYRFINKL